MVAISIVKEDLETLTTRIQLSGLVTDGRRYDVYRVQYRNLGPGPTGVRTYERELPDRKALWSAVGHRVGWQPGAGTVTFRDFDCPMRPIRYFVCETSVTGPHEWLFESAYPISSKGVLSAELIHWWGDLQDIKKDPGEGHIVLRSVHELAHYATACVVELDVGYTARVNEFPVMGNPYPVIVADTREGRRGSITLLTRNLDAYNSVRRIVFPSSGKIRTLYVQGGGDRQLLLDDMKIVPLDVTIEQTSKNNPELRWITIDYIEADNSAPLVKRAGDNDSLVNVPVANFTISDTTPRVGQWITLTDTSTGQGDDWSWTVSNTQDNRVGAFYTQGPHKVRFPESGEKTIKLRFGGSGAGYNSRVKTVQVG